MPMSRSNKSHGAATIPRHRTWNRAVGELIYEETWFVRNRTRSRRRFKAARLARRVTRHR